MKHEIEWFGINFLNDAEREAGFVGIVEHSAWSLDRESVVRSYQLF